MKNQKRLLDACFYYDFSTYRSDMEEIKEIKRSLPKKARSLEGSIQLVSNGSIGAGTGYSLGPHGQNLLETTEGFQRGCKKKGLLRLSTLYPFQKKANTRVGEDYLVADLSLKRCVDFMEGFLEASPEKTHIEVAPEVFMLMCCHDELMDMLLTRGISVITTSGDAYSRDGLKARDRMMDWKTGCNFYECAHGGRHIMPIWFEDNGTSHNILNLTDFYGHPVSDMLAIRAFSECSCGGVACDFRFVSHFKKKPLVGDEHLDMESLMRNVRGRYTNFQVIFDGKKAQVLTCEFDPCATHEDDFCKVRKALENFGFAVSRRRNCFARVGRKRPLVWSGLETLTFDCFGSSHAAGLAVGAVGQVGVPTSGKGAAAGFRTTVPAAYRDGVRNSGGDALHL